METKILEEISTILPDGTLYLSTVDTNSFSMLKFKNVFNFGHIINCIFVMLTTLRISDWSECYQTISQQGCNLFIVVNGVVGLK